MLACCGLLRSQWAQPRADAWIGSNAGAYTPAFFSCTERELHLLRDGLTADQHGIDPEAAYRLLQQLRR